MSNAEEIEVWDSEMILIDTAPSVVDSNIDAHVVCPGSLHNSLFRNSVQQGVGIDES